MMAGWLVVVDTSNGHVSIVDFSGTKQPGTASAVAKSYVLIQESSVQDEFTREGSFAAPGWGTSRTDFVLLDGHARLRSKVGCSSEDESPVGDVLAAYQTSGRRFVDDLDGQWSVLIVDRRRCRVLAARDATGTRPLYYRSHGPHWIFGSSAQHLASVSSVPGCGVDFQSMVEWICRVRIRPSSTAFSGVRRLPPGCCLEVKDERACLSGWWQPTPWVAAGVSSTGGHQARFESALEESILDSFRDAKVPAVALSSGLDSSTIAVIAKRLHQKNQVVRPLALSWRFPQYPESDESTRILPTLENLRLEAIWGYPTPYVALERAFVLADHPQELLAFPVFSELGRVAKQVGVDAIALGTSGDTVGGRPSRWRHLSREHPADSGSTDLFAPYQRARQAAAAVLGGTPPWLDQHNQIVSKCLRQPISTSVCRRINKRGQWVYAPPFGARPEECFELEGAADDQATTVAHLLGIFGVKPVFPFLDRRVVEQSLALPPALRSRCNLGRWAEREICRDVLPAHIWLMRQKFFLDRFHDDFRRQVVRRYWPGVASSLSAYINFGWLERAMADNAANDRRLLDVAYRVTVASGWLNARSDHGNQYDHEK